MAYSVKEIFYTLQGEGANAGRPSVFCRFAGCNLWTGREEDRASAICKFCDTDFIGTDGDGGGKFATARELAQAVAARWPASTESQRGKSQRFVVCTGGEPLLQLDAALIAALHEEGFVIAVETNGTVAVPDGIDWVCVSPKIGSKFIVERGQELKLVYPQEVDPDDFLKLDFENFYLQPKDGPDAAASLAATIDYCRAHPAWRLSLQTHKIIGIR
ncbi:7-carboxy-7-deazaguanine synthase, Cx14CxxC type [Bryocella elongata]|uniref:7-carboxy-7-deazaguanine synthase n=1 Tax=Bryocella elongata TaxID=863522 RepID=A0A1H6CB88_9BACT|nr:7-carboxy-7-deazaguanine synthase [Bryocella elongata]SEG70162.1 7-carboxy-7-deazaguanine synthase, Cx14CxxC type [Bryocella elongata]